ncbi:MAG: hypothetical protein M5U19_06305 [Microthrixaceae bacterium]|nr:hypothetical protein [Microthrixaceae bacterium]
MDHAAADLERNADDQLRASDSVVDATAGTPTPAPAAPGTSIHTTAGDPGPPPLGDPLPLRTEVWEIGGALAAGLGASGTARITVSELPGGRLAAWLEDVDAVTASVGASVDVGVQAVPGWSWAPTPAASCPCTPAKVGMWTPKSSPGC